MAERGSSADSLSRPTAKSESAAAMYSFAGWVGPVALGTLIMFSGNGGSGDNPGVILGGFAIGSFGLIAGPGLGHAYAGNKRQFWIGSGLRLAAVGGAFTSFAVSWNQTDTRTAETVFIGCAAVYLISAIYDVSTADRSARKYNQKHQLGTTDIRPCYFAEQKAVGMRLTIQL